MQIQRLVCQQAGQIGQWFGNNHKLELAFAAYYNRGCGFTSLSKLRTCSGLNWMQCSVKFGLHVSTAFAFDLKWSRQACQATVVELLYTAVVVLRNQ